MIACITDAELSFGSYTLPVLRHDAEPALQRMAGQLFSIENGAGEDAKAQKEARQRALAELQKMWREQNQPDSEETWLRAASTSGALSFLADPAEDIYTLADGEPLRDAL